MENIEFRIHKVPVLPKKLIKGHIYFEHSTGYIHVATSEDTKQSFGGSSKEFSIKKITEDVNEDIKEMYSLVDENGNEIGDKIVIYKDAVIDDVNSDFVVISDKIPVTGGPLSDLLIKSGINEIDANMSLQSLLKSLFCKETWPNVTRTIGSITGTNSANTCSLTVKNGSEELSSGALVYPNTKCVVTVKQNPIGSYSVTPNKISGMTHGYSWENDNKRDSSDTNIVRNWSVQQSGSPIYKLNVNINGTSESAEKNSLITSSKEFLVKKGTNTCSAASYGLVSYIGTVDEIKKCYIISNLGKTDIDHYVEYVPNLTSEINCGNLTTPSTTSTFTIYGTLPVFHNIKNNSFNADADVEMKLTTNKTFTITGIPSEERESGNFMFDFPEEASVSSVTIIPNPTKYKIYSNIDSNKIGTSFTKDHGYWKESIEILDVPGESGNARFAIEYPACAKLDYVQTINGLTGKYENYTQYKEELIKRNNDSYIRLTMTHEMPVGATKYLFVFLKPESSIDSSYKIDSGIKKTINGIQYNYKRLTTTNNVGFVERTITLNKSLNT